MSPSTKQNWSSVLLKAPFHVQGGTHDLNFHGQPPVALTFPSFTYCCDFSVSFALREDWNETNDTEGLLVVYRTAFSYEAPNLFFMTVPTISPNLFSDPKMYFKNSTVSHSLQSGLLMGDSISWFGKQKEINGLTWTSQMCRCCKAYVLPCIQRTRLFKRWLEFETIFSVRRNISFLKDYWIHLREGRDNHRIHNTWPPGSILQMLNISFASSKSFCHQWVFLASYAFAGPAWSHCKGHAIMLIPQ